MAESEIILAADTGTRHCAIALCRTLPASGILEIMAQSTVDRHKLHAERLLDGVHWILDAAECRLDQVTALAVTVGPGSFTGLRVGVATWKGLAFALKAPLVPVPTLDAMSRLAPVAEGVVIPLLDARMNEVFGAAYRYSDGVREKLTPDRVCPVGDLLSGDYMNDAHVYLLGEGAWRFESDIRGLAPRAHLLAPCSGTPRADLAAEEAWALMRAGIGTDPAAAAPRYLRASQAEQARAARLADGARPA